MRYLNNYNEFRLNEGIFGNLFKSLKNKLSLGLSKQFGSAKDADRVADAYKQESINAQQQKLQYVKALGEYIKSLEDGGEKDASKIEELKKGIQQGDENFKKQLGIIKQKFDIKFKEVVDSEDNKKIVNYIKLKKLEIEQELLAKELQMVQEAGLSEEDMKEFADFEEMVGSIKKRMEDSQTEAKKQQAEIEKKSETALGFDFEAAKTAADSGDIYLWEKGKFATSYEFEPEEKIVYFSGTNYETDGKKYKGTNAKVIKTKVDDEDKIGIQTLKGKNEFEINKGTIISSEKDRK